MMRKAAAVIAAIFCLVASQVHALGLGTISLESSLNQPLRARIEIIDLGAVSPAEVSIQMATQQDFERFDLERTGFLSNVDLEIERTADGVFVMLTSSQAVREPFLSFILDTRWPSGRILSEHTVLLDLPVFSEGQAVAEPVNQPVSPVVENQQGTVNREPAGGQAVTTPENVAAEPAAPAPAAVDPAPAPQNQTSSASPNLSDTLEIQELDTLWEIAMRVRPAESVSIQQTMLAIQRMNPQAFAGGNINRLIAGETLQVPDLSDIQSVNQQQAVSEVNRQNQQADLSAQPLTAPSAGPSSQASESRQGQLRVLTAEDADPVSGTGSAAVEAENAQLDAEILALETQLLIQQEEADRVRLQQAEMMSRLDDLDAQIASAMEIIRLQDQQLAMLQESLAAAEAEAASQPAAAGTTAASLTQSRPLQSSPPSFLDSVTRVLSNSSTVLAIVVALVVLLMVMLLIRRNRLAAEGMEDDFGDELTVDRVAGTAAADQQVNAENFEIPDQSRKDEETVAEVAELANTAMTEDAFDSDDVEDFDIGGYEADEEPVTEVGAGEELDVEISIEDEGEQPADLDAIEDDELEIHEKTDWQVGTVTSADESGSNTARITDGNEEAEAAEDAEGSVDFELDTVIDEADRDEADLDVVDFDIDEFLDEDDNDVAARADRAAAVDFDLGDEVDDASEASAEHSAEEKDEKHEEVLDLDEADLTSGSAGDTGLDDFESLDLETGEVESADAPEKTASAEFVDFDQDPDDSPTSAVDGNTGVPWGDESSNEHAEEPVTDLGDGPAEDSDDVEMLDFDLSDTGLEGFGSAAKGDQVDVSSDADDEVESFDFELADDPADSTDEEQEKAAAADTEVEQKSDRKQEDDDPGHSIDIETDAAIELGDLDFLSADGETTANGADEDIEFLSDDDEAATKLDLAYAYQKMGDVDGAKEILEEVINEGNDAQASEARTLIASLAK